MGVVRRVLTKLKLQGGAQKLKAGTDKRGEVKIAQLLNISNTSKPWLCRGVPLKKKDKEKTNPCA